MKRYITILMVIGFLSIASFAMAADWSTSGSWSISVHETANYSDSVDLVHNPDPVVTTNTQNPDPVVVQQTSTITKSTRDGIRPITRTFSRTRTRTITQTGGGIITNGGIHFDWEGEGGSQTQFPPP